MKQLIVNPSGTLKKAVLRRLLAAGITVLAMTFAIPSCTDKFGDIEVNLIAGSADSVASLETAKGMMLEAMPLIHDLREHSFQYQRNLHIDNYSGYLCVANNLEGRLPSTYFLNSDFESGPIYAFLRIIRQVVPVMNSAERLNFPELGAIATVIFCYASQELTDIHGPMPYADFRKLKENPPMHYMPVKDIYYDIFNQLENAVNVLKKANLTGEQKNALAFFDKIGEGNIANWIKFANTLRLRMAMHIKKADPEKARAVAEAAVKDGVLEKNDKDIEFAIPAGDQNPLFTISDSWNDTRLNANFEIILKRLGNPLLEVLFEDNSAPLEDKNGKMTLEEPHEEYLGIRPGTAVFNKNENLKAYILFSKISPNFASRPISIMKSVEAIFLRAEGALYGWNMGGPPKQFYEDAIRLSFQKEFKQESDFYYMVYMQTDKPKPVTYTDYYDSNNNFNKEEFLVQVGNKWIDADTNERKLERIITQKHIANFPESLESWTDIRRTGYPRQMPLVYDAGDHSCRGGIIRRIPFQLEGPVSAGDVQATGIPALGGEGDYQGTRLWWDVNQANF